MDKYKKYFPITIFIVLVAVLVACTVQPITTKYTELGERETLLKQKQTELQDLERKQNTVLSKKKKLEQSRLNSPKKVYSPIETDLGDDSLFFTLYSDVIEMLHSNLIKIQTIDYKYNPEGDPFVKFNDGKDTYFVCDIDMDLVSNYINLGKLIQDIYQYPYYIKINSLDVMPYKKDKKVLLSKLSLRLYAHTEPEVAPVTPEPPLGNTKNTLNKANTPLPQ